MPSPAPAIENAGPAAWHGLFRTATPQALLAAVNAGLVPVPCLDTNGNDLLTTMLCRNLVDLGAPVHVFGMATYQRRPLYEEQYQALVGLLHALLGRADVEPFRFQDVAAAGLSVTESAPVDMALGWGLEGLAVKMLESEVAPKGDALAQWNRALEGQVGAVGHRSQLAVALARNQAEVVDALVRVGVSVNEVDPMGYTPLFSAPSLVFLQKLLAAGADMGAHTVKLSPAEHWSKAMAKLSNDHRKDLKEMVAFVSDRFGASGALPVIFLQSEELRAFKNTDPGLPGKIKAWTEKWAAVCSKVPKNESPLGWTRVQPSGIWKGNISVVAQIGINLIEFPCSLHPALIDLKPWLLDKQPVQVRRGITDRGLFALGAFNLLNNYKEFTSARLMGGSIHQDKLVNQATEALRDLLSLHSNDEWLGWMTETSLALQRSNVAGSRQVVADAWVNFLAFAAVPENGWGVQRSAEKNGIALDLAGEFLDRGGNLCGLSWLKFLTKEGQMGMRTSFSSARARLEAQERQPAFRAQWAQLFLSTFMGVMDQNGVKVSSGGYLDCTDHKTIDPIVSEAIKTLNESMQGTTSSAVFRDHPHRHERMYQAVSFLGKMKDASPQVRGLVLATQLPLKGALERTQAPKPRF